MAATNEALKPRWVPISEAICDGRKKHQAVYADLQGAVDQRQMPNFAASHRRFNAVGFGTLLFSGQLCDQRITFFLGQKAGLPWAIVEIEKGEDAEDDGRQPFQHEHPESAGLAQHAVHLQQCPRQR